MLRYAMLCHSMLRYVLLRQYSATSQYATLHGMAWHCMEWHGTAWHLLQHFRAACSAIMHAHVFGVLTSTRIPVSLQGMHDSPQWGMHMHIACISKL